MAAKACRKMHVCRSVTYACDLAHVPTCPYAGSGTSGHDTNTGTRVLGLHGCTVCTQHEHGTHTCVFLCPVTQLVSFQRIQLVKDSCWPSKDFNSKQEFTGKGCVVFLSHSGGPLLHSSCNEFPQAGKHF